MDMPDVSAHARQIEDAVDWLANLSSESRDIALAAVLQGVRARVELQEMAEQHAQQTYSSKPRRARKARPDPALVDAIKGSLDKKPGRARGLGRGLPEVKDVPVGIIEG